MNSDWEVTLGDLLLHRSQSLLVGWLVRSCRLAGMVGAPRWEEKVADLLYTFSGVFKEQRETYHQETHQEGPFQGEANRSAV